MRIIKLALISFIFFAVMITMISLFFPSHVRISKAIDINAQKDAVLMEVKEVSNWKHWYPGADSILPKVSFNHVSDSLIEFSQVPRAMEAFRVIQTERPGTTTVQWYMDVHLRWYPWEKFSSIMLEKRYGPFMEKGLGSLKSYVERK